ncbi:MAG: hypothetical protein GYB41_04410 [Oceanospirillales bacterium]|nr:hypothetical protein [Oceanospirillales bacterium]
MQLGALESQSWEYQKYQHTHGRGRIEFAGIHPGPEAGPVFVGEQRTVQPVKNLHIQHPPERMATVVDETEQQQGGSQVHADQGGRAPTGGKHGFWGDHLGFIQLELQFIYSSNTAWLSHLPDTETPGTPE